MQSFSGSRDYLLGSGKYLPARVEGRPETGTGVPLRGQGAYRFGTGVPCPGRGTCRFGAGVPLQCARGLRFGAGVTGAGLAPGLEVDGDDLAPAPGARAQDPEALELQHGLAAVRRGDARQPGELGGGDLDGGKGRLGEGAAYGEGENGEEDLVLPPGQGLAGERGEEGAEGRGHAGAIRGGIHDASP